MGITKADEIFLQGLAGPQHWTEADARRALAVQEASGEGDAEFGRRYGLRPTRLGWWRRRLREWRPDEVAEAAGGEGTASSAGGFVELMVSAQAGRSAATVRVGDVVVELATLDEAAAQFVASLKRALGDDRCC